GPAHGWRPPLSGHVPPACSRMPGTGGHDPGSTGRSAVLTTGCTRLKTDPVSRTLVDICALDELPPGAKRVVEWEDLEIGVVNCDGEILAIEDRCSHDNGDLMEGEVDTEACTVECPRHGSVFDLRT